MQNNRGGKRLMFTQELQFQTNGDEARKRLIVHTRSYNANMGMSKEDHCSHKKITMANEWDVPSKFAKDKTSN
ncbi:hypothetical protein KSS87_003566 [Heliosperma pusillum]|nr:hypothetical protein KSS87_003566 [Heliosperma pusillum]